MQVSNEETYEKNKSKLKTRLDLLKLAYQDVLATESGRQVLWDILSNCSLFTGGFSGEKAHYLEGRRDVGLELIRQINAHNPDAYMRMMIEARRQDA